MNRYRIEQFSLAKIFEHGKIINYIRHNKYLHVYEIKKYIHQ
jgi:hypothetical protein